MPVYTGSLAAWPGIQNKHKGKGFTSGHASLFFFIHHEGAEPIQLANFSDPNPWVELVEPHKKEVPQNTTAFPQCVSYRFGCLAL